MKKLALIIMFISLLSKLLGFVREIVLSYFFGASSISDAYIISLTVPNVIFGFIGVGIVTAFIPMLSRIISESGEEAGSEYTSGLTNIVLIIVTAMVLAGIMFTEPMVRIFAQGFSDEVLKLTINFTKISLFGMYFTALISIYSGYLQIKSNYIVPALIGFPFSIITIITILIAAGGNYNVLAFGTVIAGFAQVLLISFFVKKEKFKYSFSINFKNPRIIKTLYIAIPVIIGTSVNQINILVNRTIASSIAIGGISALNYADTLNSFVHGLFALSIITVIYPILSSFASTHNYEGIKKVLRDSISIITILVLPISIGIMIFSTQIIKLLFGRGAFDEQAIQMTSAALFFYAIGMVAIGLREILARCFYSMQDTKTPMINASIGLVLNIILTLILSKYLGIGGLALATSISAIFITGLLFISLRKKLGPFGLKQIIISFIKIMIASLSMGLLAKLSFLYFIDFTSQNISFLIAIGAGVVSYLILIYFMKIEDVDLIVDIIKKKYKGDN